MNVPVIEFPFHKIMEQYYKKLPKKRMGAGALIFNRNGKILIIKPVHKEHWSTPGGTIDKNESPRDACLREVHEEIGLKLKKADFVCVDYIPRHSSKDESVQYVFNCGVITDEQISKIKLQTSEVLAYRFVSLKEARPLLGRVLAVRLTACVRAVEEHHALYLEDGLRPDLVFIHHKKHRLR